MERKKIKLAIPKGSLQNYTLEVFRSAGFEIKVLERTYRLKIDDLEIEPFLLRPQEIPKYIERGKLDLGISGKDWILDSNARVIEICDLKYAKRKIKKVKWVLAVPQNSKIKSLKDLEGKTIATEIVNVVKDYLQRNKIKAKVKFSWGSTEVKPPRFADAIVDLIETGASLRAHNLKVLDTVLTSSTKLIANKSAFLKGWKKRKIEKLALLLKGAVRGKEMVNLTMEVPKKKLAKVLKILPKLKAPTIEKIIDQNSYQLTITCLKKGTRELIPQLKKMGCSKIIEWPIIKLVL